MNMRVGSSTEWVSCHERERLENSIDWQSFKLKRVIKKKEHFRNAMASANELSQTVAKQYSMAVAK